MRKQNLIERARDVHKNIIRSIVDQNNDFHKVVIGFIISYMNETQQTETSLNVACEWFPCGWCSKLQKIGNAWFVLEHGNDVVDGERKYGSKFLYEIPTEKLIEIYENIVV